VVYAVNDQATRQCGNLGLTSDTPMFMTTDMTDKIYVTRLDADGNFVWPGNKVTISSTSSITGDTKMRHCFTPNGPNKFAGSWSEKRSTEYRGYAQGISIGGLIGVDVKTQGGVPAEITVQGGTLQLVATVYPAAADQDVTWNIVPGSGTASISASGLVTAISDGNVFAVAVAVQDTTVSDTLMIDISGQSTGIGQNNPFAFEISPVPNRGVFTITLNNDLEQSWELSICNTLGMSVYSNRVTAAGGTLTIPVDLGKVPGGLYTVILSNGEKKLVRKVLVN
jgi:hypothetical protein